MKTLEDTIVKAKRMYKDAIRGYDYNTEVWNSLNNKVLDNKQDIKELDKAKQNRIRFMAQITTLEDLFGASNLRGIKDEN